MHPRVVFALPAAVVALVLVGSAGAAVPARESPVGALDPGFASGGWLTEAFTPNPGSGEGRDAALQPDGKIVVLTTPVDDYLSRYLPGGTLDTSFGSGGSVALPTTAKASYEALTVDSQGRIIVVGFEVTTWWRAPEPAGDGTYFQVGRWGGVVYRFLPNGTLDPSFGVGGKATINVPAPAGLSPGSPNTLPYAVVTASDGSITVGGQMNAICAWEYGGAGSSFSEWWEAFGTFAARLHSDGTTETQFGPSGVVSTHGGCTNSTGVPEYFGALAEPSPGAVVTVSAHPEDNSWRFRFYTATGASNEVQATSPDTPNPGEVELPTQIVALPNHDLLVAAIRENLVSHTSWEVLRQFTSAGAVDVSFGTGGVVHVPMECNGLAFTQPFGVLGDGRILIAGLDYMLKIGMGVMRYLPDGSVDETFGGKYEGGYQRRPGQAWAVLTYPDDLVNKLLIMGGQPLVIGRTEVMGTGGIRQNQTALALFRADGRIPEPPGEQVPPGGSGEKPPPVLGPPDPPIYQPGTGGGGGSSAGGKNGPSGNGGQHESHAATVLDALTAFLKSLTPHAISRLLKTGGYALAFDAPEPGVLSVRWTSATTQASRRTSHAAKPIVVASGTRTFPAAGRGRLTLHLTAIGRKLLRKNRVLSITETASFAPTDGATVTRRATATIRPTRGT
jgi:uncharacterized delta-60 repeat protein